MAIRNLRIEGDPILRKTSRVVEELNENIINLIEDMKETMYLNEGVGLAAPQVGVLKRVVVVDVGDVDEDDEQLGKG
ncbi:MAG: peptide deformylase, partial [Peptoanaerobacter stomatis]